MDYSLFITELLTNGAKIAAEYYGRASIKEKLGDNNQVLTEADLAIGESIVSAIRKKYPQHNIIDEEAGVINNKSAVTWVVDPIDGTSNFAQGLPTYGVMVGVMVDGSPIAGGIALPAFNELYVAQKGSGAFCNGVRLQVSGEQDLSKVLVAYGIDGHREEPTKTTSEMDILERIVVSIRNLRTTNSAYDMAHAVSGRYGAYLNQTTKVWDNVALQPLIEEAGGIVTDFWGKPLDYSHALTNPSANMTICVAAPTLHKQLQMLIHGS